MPGTSSDRFPPLTAAQLETVLFGAADVVLALGHDRRIQALRTAPGFDVPAEPDWIDRTLDEVICVASRAKLPSLLSQGSADGKARWRHMNFYFGGVSVPLLVRYYGFDGVGGGRHVIVGRDLRPTVAMQAKVQRAVIEMEQRAEDQRTDPRLSDLAAQVGERPLDLIVDEMARMLERLCIAEALRRSGADSDAAAQMLGIEPQELARRRQIL